MPYYVGSIPFGQEDIYHFGVKGMKWGVRRYQNPDGTLTGEGRRKYLNEYGTGLNDRSQRKFFRGGSDRLSFKGRRTLKKAGADSDIGRAIRSEKFARTYERNWVKAYNKTADIMNNKIIPEVNAKWKDKKGGATIDNPGYVRDIGAAYKREYDKVLLSEFGEHPALGKKWVEHAMMRDMYDDFDVKRRR